MGDTGFCHEEPYIRKGLGGTRLWWTTRNVKNDETTS